MVLAVDGQEVDARFNLSKAHNDKAGETVTTKLKIPQESDNEDFRGKELAVVGGGDSAVPVLLRPQPERPR